MGAVKNLISRLNGRVQRPKTEKNALYFLLLHYSRAMVGGRIKKKSFKMSQTQWKYCVALWKHESAVKNLISRLNGRVQRPKTEKMPFISYYYTIVGLWSEADKKKSRSKCAKHSGYTV